MPISYLAVAADSRAQAKWLTIGRGIVMVMD
jgi:hypothetical protein